MDEIDDAQKKLIVARFEKRHAEMIARHEQQRQAKQQRERESDADVFVDAFNNEKRQLSAQLLSLDDMQDKVEITASFDQVSQKMSLLQKFVSDSASSLPSYDVRRAQEILSQLRNDINAKREFLLPKKKFAFKSRQKMTKKEDIDKTDGSKDLPNNTALLQQTHGFSNKICETLTLLPNECDGKQISLLNMQDCTVIIKGCPLALRIKNASKLTLHCGPVSRAIFINNCYDSTLHLACQQLRIHSTTATRFHILVRSKAIIEDCSDVGFAPYNWTYDDIDEHFTKAGLDCSVNNWRDVDDFNWLKLDEKSPNWFIIENDDK